MPQYNFLIETTSKGRGYVYADTIGEAKEKIINGDYEDIYDHVDEEYGEIIDIYERSASNVSD